jgi:chaperonin GroES
MAKTKITPLGERVLVRRIEEEESKVGSLYIPDTAKEKPQQAKVVAVGQGKKKEDGSRIPMDVCEGDIVLISKYAGTEVKIEGEEHLILREDDILGIIAK